MWLCYASPNFAKRNFTYPQNDVPTDPKEERRGMALDMNAEHIDFAVMDKENFEVVSVGRVEIYETRHVSGGKSEYRIHEAVDKIK